MERDRLLALCIQSLHSKEGSLVARSIGDESIVVWTASWPRAPSRHFQWGGNYNQTRAISNISSRLTARRRVTSSLLPEPGGRTGLDHEDITDFRTSPGSPAPTPGRCPLSMWLTTVDFTHHVALIVRRGSWRTSAVFFGPRKTCLGTVVKRCSSIALQSFNIPRRRSRSPLRLPKQCRELKLASDGSFRRFCPYCTLRAELHKTASSFEYSS